MKNRIGIIVTTVIVVFLSFVSLFFISGCVNPDYSEIDNNEPVSVLPLEVGNRWIYEVKIDNSITYFDTAEVTEFKNYTLNNGDYIFLHLYKEISLDYENSNFIDTIYYRLLKIEDNCLFEYGVERRDQYNFYLDHTMYEERIKKVDYSNPILNVLYETDRYIIESKGYYDLDLNNGMGELHTIKVNHIFDYTDYLYQSNRGDFDIYYSDIGIVYINGEIYDNFVEVKLVDNE